MDLADIAQEGNEKAIRLCQEFLDKLGPGREYTCGVASAASALLFHLYRLGRDKGDSIPRLQALLDDVSDNVTKVEGGQKVLFTVERPYEGSIPFGHYQKIDDVREAYKEKREFRLLRNLSFPITKILEESNGNIVHYAGKYHDMRVAGVFYIQSDIVTVQDYGS